MIRRFGETPQTSVPYKVRPGAYGVLIRDGQVLLTFQNHPEPEFQLPGGGIDPGESLIPALRREIFEETGWAIGTPRRIGAFRRFVYMPEYDLWANKLCHLFLARPALRISAPTETGHSCHWVPPDVAIELIKNTGDRHFLDQTLRQVL